MHARNYHFSKVILQLDYGNGGGGGVGEEEGGGGGLGFKSLCVSSHCVG